MKKSKTKKFNLEQFEREARQRTAWAYYAQQMNYIRAVDEENEYQMAKYKRDEDKVKEIENKRKNRNGNMLVIM